MASLVRYSIARIRSWGSYVAGWSQGESKLFLPLEYKAGGEDEPVAVRYSLGWTVIGPVGGQKDGPKC